MKRLNTKIVLLYLFSFQLKCTGEVICYTPRNTKVAYRIYTEEFRGTIPRELYKVAEFYVNNVASYAVIIPHSINGDINQKCFCNKIKRGFEVKDGKLKKDEKETIFFRCYEQYIVSYEIISLYPSQLSKVNSKITVYEVNMNEYHHPLEKVKRLLLTVPQNVIK
jgi:hypothetical protein